MGMPRPEGFYSAFAGISQRWREVRGVAGREVRVAPGGIEGLETRGELGDEGETRCVG